MAVFHCHPDSWLQCLLISFPRLQLAWTQQLKSNLHVPWIQLVQLSCGFFAPARANHMPVPCDASRRLTDWDMCSTYHRKFAALQAVRSLGHLWPFYFSSIKRTLFYLKPLSSKIDWTNSNQIWPSPNQQPPGNHLTPDIILAVNGKHHQTDRQPSSNVANWWLSRTNSQETAIFDQHEPSSWLTINSSSLASIFIIIIIIIAHHWSIYPFLSTQKTIS